jgi:hypothetical protein
VKTNRWSASQINWMTLRIEEAEDGLGASVISKALKIGRASVYRVLRSRSPAPASWANVHASVVESSGPATTPFCGAGMAGASDLRGGSPPLTTTVIFVTWPVATAESFGL